MLLKFSFFFHPLLYFSFLWKHEIMRNKQAMKAMTNTLWSFILRAKQQLTILNGCCLSYHHHTQKNNRREQFSATQVFICFPLKIRIVYTGKK